MSGRHYFLGRHQRATFLTPLLLNHRIGDG